MSAALQTCATDIHYQPLLICPPSDHQYNSQLIFTYFEKCIRAQPKQYMGNHNRFFR